MIKSLYLAFIALMCASCSPNVYVVDEQGLPIENAQIFPQSRGFSWPPKTTDKKGSALVHQDVPSIETLRVTKPGYRIHAPVNYNLPKPITVVLER